MNLLSTLQAYGTSEGAQRSWDTRGRGRKQLSDKAQRARETYVPATQEKQRMAELSEKIIAGAINGNVTSNNSPFDIVKGKIGVEVKTIFPGVKHDKITMHPESRMRKLQAAKKLKLTAYTVIVDRRTDKVYYAKGVASFRLRNTEEVSLKELSRKLQ